MPDPTTLSGLYCGFVGFREGMVAGYGYSRKWEGALEKDLKPEAPKEAPSQRSRAPLPPPPDPSHCLLASG